MGVKLSSPAAVQTTDGLRAEKEELEKMINRLEGEVAATKTDLDQMTAQRDASVSEQDAIASRLDELMDTSAKDKALVEADRDDKDAQIESLEKELADVKETLEESNAQFIDSITTARNELDEKLSKETARAVAAETEITKVNTQAEAQKTRLDVEIAEKVAQIQQGDDLRSNLETEIAGLKKDLELSQDEVSKNLASIEGLKVTIDGLKIENLSFKKEAKKAQDELASSSSTSSNDIAVLKNEVETQKKNVSRRDSELSSAQSQVTTLRADLDTRTKELSESKVETEKMTADRDSLKLLSEKVSTEYKAEIEKVTANFQEEREVASTRFQQTISQLEETMKGAEAASQQQLADMSDQRKRVEERNETLQGELTTQQRKYKEVSASIVDVKTDLSKAQLTLNSNVAQFRQLAADLEAAGQLNDKLKEDLSTQKADWDEDKARSTGVQEEMTKKIADCELQVSDEQAKVLRAREEVIEANTLQEQAATEAKTSRDRVAELEETVENMEAAAVAAEELREELRLQHSTDLQNGTEEREHLEKKCADLTADCNDLQMKLDTTRQELLDARQNFSEEKVRREARDAEVASGKTREEQLNDTVRDKDEALEKAQEAALDGEHRSAEELMASQAKVEQLQTQNGELQEQIDTLQLDVSTWKATAGEYDSKAQEYLAKSEAEGARADDAEDLQKSTAAELAQTQDDW